MTNQEVEKRVLELRQYVEYKNNNCVYRSEFFRLAGESLRETKGESRQVRRAKATAHVFDHVKLVTQPYEVIGGTIASIYPQVETAPYEERKEEARQTLLQYVQERSEAERNEARITLYNRVHYHSSILYQQLQRIIRELFEEMGEAYDLTHLEVGRVLERYFNWDFGEDAALVGELPWEVSNHNDINPANFLSNGLGAIRQKILDYMDGCDPEKKEFYECELLVMDSVIGYVRRYGETFRAAAEEEGVTPQRAVELNRMADACAKVATEAPETFFEAMQLLWLLYVAYNMQSCAGTTGSFARFDQYMNSFYQRDLAAGRITEEEAQLLVCNLFAKINEPKMRVVISMSIGGQTPEGKDGANDVTRLCLRAIQILRQPYPNVSARIFNGSADWYYDMVVETVKLGVGNPFLYNDEAMVPNMYRYGFTLEDARDYYNVGCVEPMIMSKNAVWQNLSDIVFPGEVLKVLNNGGPTLYYTTDICGEDEPIITNIKGFSPFPFPVPPILHTGEPEELDTFDKFMNALRSQIFNSMSDLKDRCDIAIRVLDEYWFDPFASLFHCDCIEKGLDIFSGGARYYPMYEIIGNGIATAVDSISAIKKFVYEDKVFTLRQMRDMVNANFEGYEMERLLLQNKTPCFGNNDPEVDRIYAEVMDWFFDALDRVNHMGIKGYVTSTVYSYTAQVAVGEVVPATPNGRKAGEMISNSITPSQGKDVRGPVNTLNSVTALDHKILNGATTVTIKFNPSLVKGKQGTENLKSIIKGYFRNKGVQLQVNMVDKETLLDAQKYPEKHSDLIVRVGGYCEYFNNLDQKLQDEVIAHVVQDM